MPTVSEMFPSSYVAAADLRGQPLAVTIDRIVHEVVDPATGEKAYICFFAGYKRGLRLNKINARTIGKIHGVEALGWSGKVIELYPTLTTMKGEEVDCIRVRASAQAAAPVATLPAHDAAPPVAVPPQMAPAPMPAPQAVPPQVPVQTSAVPASVTF